MLSIILDAAARMLKIWLLIFFLLKKFKIIGGRGFFFSFCMYVFVFLCKSVFFMGNKMSNFYGLFFVFFFFNIVQCEIIYLRFL